MALVDFTTFTEVDPSSHWSQTSPRNTLTLLTAKEESYVYKDYGVGTFQDFEHIVDFNLTINAGTGWTKVGVWGVTNDPDSWDYMANGLIIFADAGIGSNYRLDLRNRQYIGSYDQAFNLVSGTSYYLKITRSGTTTTCIIYTSDTDRIADTNRFDTLSIIHATVTNYRYLMGGFSHGNYFGGTQTYSGYIENLDEGIVVPLEFDETITLSDEVALSDVSQISQEGLSISDDFESYIISSSSVLNKINTVIEITKDADSKINTAINVISDCANLVSLVNGEVGDMDNDIRTLAESTNNVQNDVRILADYQIPGDAGFQSLGKEYIKVYIGGNEQTDLDVDSVTITKIINGIHTASFELGRAYDSTKPDMESVVLIKYHNWLLYKGYISSITPASTPESIRINCSDKYWKRNREKVYFFVGHKPTDDKEKYYYYISTALSTAIGWNPGIGNFVPQTMSLFGTSESDAITNLITESGNFGWYYDENEEKKLWEAGRGSIINLERQEIGKNLGLYQVLRHSFTENVLNIVNKLRIHMGDKVIRRFNATGGTKEYPGYTYESIHTAVNPDWNYNYEVLAKNSDNGYGWDWHKSSDNDKYKDVFIKYDLPFLNPDSGSWTDRYPPQVEVIIPYSLWWECSVEEGIMTEGFTIDYENQKLTFNKPIYLSRKDEKGENEEIRAPMVSLRLWKKRYYSNTEDESDDPESDISYPLMFFTDKVGTYPETIMELLQLTNLSIQYGGGYRDADGNWVVIPSWNDTAFAKDYAYWQLSNTAYKQINGSIDVTLDTAVTYGINLSNRIQIDGVTENALNINSMTYNISNFTVTVQLQNGQYYRRSVSLPSHGE